VRAESNVATIGAHGRCVAVAGSSAASACDRKQGSLRLAARRSAFAGIAQEDLRVFALNRGVSHIAPIETNGWRFLGDGGLRNGAFRRLRGCWARRSLYRNGDRRRASAAAAAGAARNVGDRRGGRIVNRDTGSARAT